MGRRRLLGPRATAAVRGLLAAPIVSARLGLLEEEKCHLSDT